MITQRELLDEGFWDKVKKGVTAIPKAASGVLGAAVKGGAKALDYVAPEITHPLHRLEAGIRDIGSSARLGYDAFSGGRPKTYKDILADAGYFMNEKDGVTRSGKNHVVSGWRILGHNKKGQPIPDKLSRMLTFLFDKNNNFKIVGTSTQDASTLVRQKPIKIPKQKTRP
jgi:hypothetical protein